MNADNPSNDPLITVMGWFRHLPPEKQGKMVRDIRTKIATGSDPDALLRTFAEWAATAETYAQHEADDNTPEDKIHSTPTTVNGHIRLTMDNLPKRKKSDPQVLATRSNPGIHMEVVEPFHKAGQVRLRIGNCCFYANYWELIQAGAYYL